MADAPPKSAPRISKRALARHNTRRAARIAAVQALYQIDFSGAPPETVIEEFKAHRLRSMFETAEVDAPDPKVDSALFEALTSGAADAAARLDPLIVECLAEGWTYERLGYLLRATLRVGAYEFEAFPERPVGTLINEYVDIAHSFFEGSEPSFVHAALDRLARSLRRPDTPDA